jgi:hypothetical protein
MLSLEPLLRTRLADIVGLKGVYGLSDLGAEKPKPAPCAYVVFDGGRVAELTDSGDKARVFTRWLVVLAIKNVAQAADGQAARGDAQPLVTAVFKKLMGWRPDQAHMPLRLVEMPRPDYQSGLLWLPLVFETQQIFSGE